MKDKVITPNVVTILRSKPNATAIVKPEPSSFRLFLRDFQPFLSSQAFDPLVIHSPAFMSKQRRDSAITIPTILGGQLNHSLGQLGFIIGNMKFPTLRGSGLIQNLASSSL